MSLQRRTRVLAALLCLALIAAAILAGCAKMAAPPETTPIGRADVIPQFAPIPQWTSAYKLPGQLVDCAAGRRLGGVFDSLTHTLNRADIEWSVYAIDTTGFAVASQLDSIREDGTPLHGDQSWSYIRPRSGFFDLGWYLGRLFKARPGRYRMIVFAVTDHALVPTAGPLSQGQAAALVHGSDVELPQWMRDLEVGGHHRCTALIYEFYRAGETDSARWVQASPIKPVAHLSNSGLWTRAELVP